MTSPDNQVNGNRPRRLLLATDAWFPQINGVVRTLDNTIKVLKRTGFEVEVVHPECFTTLPNPIYPEIRLSLPSGKKLRELIQEFKPDHVHVATEGPIGIRMQFVCPALGIRFTTAYHTMFADYLWRLCAVPKPISWRYLRWFHGRAAQTMVPTSSIQKQLESRGFTNLVRWARGSDTSLFHPRERTLPEGERPILMYIGRVSKEKNLDAFLSLETPGTKYIVGDGPYLATLKSRYPKARFPGYRTGEPLAQMYAEADLFVFPSLTDTFGNVLLEALASGVPVAAFPAPGPIDIITSPEVGALDPDLGKAIKVALENGQSDACVNRAKEFTWDNSTAQFVGNLVPAQGSSLD